MNRKVFTKYKLIKMKTLAFISILVLALQINCLSQTDSVIHIATMVVNYRNYKFEGCHNSKYTCPGCRMDSLPFFIEYQSPGDFGSILFKLKQSSDTLFSGTIMWMGTGQIIYPKKFNTKYPFNYVNKTPKKSSDIVYLDMNGTVTKDSLFIQKADSALNAIKSLSIMKNISDKKYKTAIYFYPPRVGKTDPYVAKWIIFLYYKD